MKGILLHGGHGTRLRPLTHTGPKQLLPIANKPMSEYCINSIKETGAKEIAIIIGGLGANKVKEYYGDGSKFGVKISYIEQDEPRGIAHAINLCKDFIGNEKFIVFLGDNIIQKNIQNFAKKFEESDADALILLCEVDDPSRFGIADIKNDQIVKIIEKPKNPPTNFAVTGIYFLTPVIFKMIKNLKPSWRNELEITDALQILLENKYKIIYDTITDYWKDTGTPEDIIHANGAILNKMEPYFYGTKEDGAKIEGKLMIGKNSIIQKDVEIKGPVIIGENCIIESKTKIGPNISIGNNTLISEVDIAESIIMSDCIIKGKLKIRNSIISKNSTITFTEQYNENERIFLLGEGTKILF
ncbi:glucose-1-phosphate thymidylyltransferase [Nitrosopumilus sp.]|uniref:glucose-1-phosphate thymidylyltransferase n=1 Tax=Nitrosopumilus sp. TaxID=2024843 RepID=UPI0034A00A12